MEYLTTWYQQKFHASRAAVVGSKTFHVLEMPWRDDKNKKDCGVYLMRHLEAYYGGDIRNFQCGFQKDSRAGISSLRIKYTHALVSADINVRRNQVMKNVKQYAKEKRAKQLASKKLQNK